MYISDYASAIRSDCRSWRSRLHVGSTYIHDIESVSYTNGSQSNANITIGSVVAPGINVVLTALPADLTGMSFTWELGILKDMGDFGDNLDDDDFEFIPMGNFVIRNIRKDGTRWNVECYHKLSQSDVVHTSALVFPTTAQLLMQEVVNSLGLTFPQTLSPTISIEGIPEGATKRDIMGWIGALYGGFVCADRADNVMIAWYTMPYEGEGYTLLANALGTPEISEQDVTFGAVRCIVDTNTTYTDGEGRTMTFECPFMTTAQFSSVAQALEGFTYRPCKAELLMGDPLIDPFDIVTLSYDDSSYTLPAAVLTLEHKGGVSSSIEAQGGDSATIARVDPITRAVSRLVKLISENKDEVEQDIADAITEVTESIRGGASGYFYIIDDNGVNRETIWCDNVDPAQATHGIRINAAGIGFWVKDPDDPTSTLFNGPYTQAWTIDGKLIADFIKAGTLSGITIICNRGTIGGWTITDRAIVSPDEAVRLDSTYDVPLTTHADLRSYTHVQLRAMTHRQIRYLRKQVTGKSQISASKGTDTVFMREGNIEVERSGHVAFRAGADGIEMHDGSSSAEIGWKSDIFEVSLTGGFDWTVGGSSALKYESGLLTTQNISCGKIITDGGIGITGRYGISDVSDTIEKHPGVNLYAPDSTYLGGIRAAEIGGLHGVAMSPAFPAADFFGLWAEYNAKYYGAPVFVWYKLDDTLRISKETMVRGALDICTGLDAYNVELALSGSMIQFFDGDTEVGRILRTSDDGISTRLLNGSAISWEVGSSPISVVMRYTTSDDTLHIYRGTDMHGNDLIDANIVSSSDERLKENITDSSIDCLAVINALRLIGFDWKNGGHEDIGFSAQQAGSIRADLQGEHDGRLVVNEGRLIRYLVGAVQQLTDEINRLKDGR